ncbi:MAG: AAA family ATPase [Cypionkella sp.]
MTATDKSILLITPDAAVTHDIGASLASMAGVSLRAEASMLPGLNGKAAFLAADKDIIIFETSDDEASDIASIRALKANRKAGTLLLALADGEISLSRVRALNQAGVDDVVPKEGAGAEIELRVAKHYRARQDAAKGTAPERRGRVLAVAQARGGVGATTVAVNLAHDLVGRSSFFRRLEPNTVALVDLDVQFGSVGTLLDLGEQNALHQLALDGTIPDATYLASTMVRLPNGLSVLAAPSKFMPLDSLQPRQIGAILDTLRAENDFVVVDLPHALGRWMEPVLQRADELIIVSDTAVPSVRHCRRLIEFFTTDNPNLPVRIVINHEKRSLLPSGAQKEIQKALNRKLDHWLPHDPRAARTSADRGMPLATAAPRSQLGKAIARLARDTLAEFPVSHNAVVLGKLER